MGVETTYAVRSATELRHDGELFAGALSALGVRPGGRVAVVSPEAWGPALAAQTQALYVSLIWGALRAGFVPVPINPQLTPQERGAIIADARPTLVLDSPDDYRALARITPAPIELRDGPQGRPMHYTSGTTGRSKGVWAGDLTEGESRILWDEEVRFWGFGPDDVTLVHGPLCHSGPLRFALTVALAGGSVAFTGGFRAQTIAHALKQVRPTSAFVVPAHLQRLFELGAGLPASPYRLLAHAGAACPPALKRQLHQWAGAERVWEFYGSTEGQFTACAGTEWEARPGTVGRARDGRRLFTDDGVIWCEAPAHARFRYFGDEEKTARAWRVTRGGQAFTVGDLGRLDEEGYLFIDGRREDLIITGGVNVYPAEVEAVLSDCPRVDDIAVFGRPDPRWGQAVCAAYVGEASPADVARWAGQHLAAYKRPKSFERHDALPRTASGKVRRLDLL